jgi:serine/threonine-protein kinase
MHGCSAVHLEPRRDPPDLEATGELVDPAADPHSSRYLVGAEIARGGMASIVGAFDRRLTRSIALKLLEGDSPRLAARFAREIRITASLQHPGIVPIYDSGRLPDGRRFYAMRHVQGQTLQQAIS